MFGKNRMAEMERKQKDFIKIGKGFAIEDYKQKKLLDIKQFDENRCNHTLIFGAPEVGKSKLTEGMIEQNIAKGENVIVIDSKAGTELFSKIYEVAKSYQREKEILFLNPMYPQYSISINPLKSHYIEEEIISNIVCAVPINDESFYKAIHEIVTAIIRSLLMIRKSTNNPKPVDFNEISSWVHYDKFKSLHKNVSLIENNQDKQSVLVLIEQILVSPKEKLVKTLSTLRVTLSQMITGNIGKIINCAGDNIFINRLRKDKGMIFYIQIGSRLSKQDSSIVSKIIVSMLQNLVNRLCATKDSFGKRLNLYLNEMSSYMGIETLYIEGGATNIAIVVTSRSMSSITAQIGSNRANKLFDLVGTKIIMKLNENTIAQIISELGGTRKGYSPFLSLNGGIVSREVEEINIKPEDVMRLRKREFYFFGFRGQFRGKTAPIKESKTIIKLPKLK